MTTISLNPHQTEQQFWAFKLPNLPTSYASSGEGRGRTPFFVPFSQSYYWTAEWQSGEAEALRDIELGNVTQFSSGREAAIWLLADGE